MQVEYLWADDCPKCKRIKAEGIVDDIHRVLHPLPDVHWVSLPAGEVGQERLKIMDGKVTTSTPQFSGDGVHRLVERRGHSRELVTPMVHLVVSEDNWTEEPVVEMIAESPDETLELIRSSPRFVSHLFLQRVYRFYVREELDIPRKPAGRIARNHPPDSYSEVSWINAFTEAATA